MSILSVCCCLFGCGENDNSAPAGDTLDSTVSGSDMDTSPPADTDTNTGTDTGTDTGTGTSAVRSDMSGVTQCGKLFGIPGTQTGLVTTQCVPSCDCNGSVFNPTQLTDGQIDRVAAMTLVNAPELLIADPYATESTAPPIVPAENVVCGVTVSDTDVNTYRLDTFNSPESAVAAGATVTHYGACGQCSALADLLVYMKNPDLTAPVRQCGVEGMMAGEEANIVCLKALGFSEPCAQIWYYNTVNTRTLCLETCAPLLAADYHAPTGELNACLQCDEDNSGPIFKTVAGRTRRNSGLPSGICRPCESIRHVVHEY